MDGVKRPEPSSRRAQRGAAALLAGLMLICVGCGQSSSALSAPATASSSAATGALRGTVLAPLQPAPALALRDYTGNRVDLRAYSGKAVIVTFLYTNCIDVCPLIAEKLAAALAELGAKARRLQIIAVSVDPRGDTPAAVARFLKLHHMAGRMKYLIGSTRQLAPVWRRWHVAATRNPVNHKLVVHSSVTFGITASGKLATLYGPGFAPADIVHDVPRLIDS